MGKGCSVAKILNVDSRGRPTFRFREMNIYESKDVKSIYSSRCAHQQTNRDSQVKMEMASPEEGHGLGKSNKDAITNDSEGRLPKNCNVKKSNDDCNELSINDMTLKELQIRCKAKKREVLKFVTSTEAGAWSQLHIGQCKKRDHHVPVQPIEIESDLEEPLIILKQKLRKNFKSDRKRRKCVHPSCSDSVAPVQGLNEQIQSPHCNAAQYSVPVAINNMPIQHGLPMENTGDPIPFIHIKGEVLEIDPCNSQNAVYSVDCSSSDSNPKFEFSAKSLSDVAERVLRDKSETRESTSVANNFISRCTDEVPSGPRPLPESAEPNIGVRSSKDFTEIACHILSPSLVSESEMDPLNTSSPELVYNVKSEILEPDSWNQQNAVYIADCSTSNFIAKYQYHPHDESFDEALERVNGSEPGDLKSNSFANKSLDSFVREVSTEQLAPNLFTSLPESTEENFDIMNKMESEIFGRISAPSIVSHNRIYTLYVGSPESVSQTTDLGSEFYGSSNDTITLKEIASEVLDDSEDQKNDSIVGISVACMGSNVCAFNTESEEYENSIYEAPAGSMAISSQKNDSGTDPTLMCKENNGSSDVCIFSMEGENLGNIIDKELVKEMPINIHGKGNPLELEEHSTSVTYNSCAPENSQLWPYAANNLHSIDDNSPEMEKTISCSTIEKGVDAIVDEASTCSSNVSPPAVVEETKAVEALKCLYPQNSHQCSGTASESSSKTKDKALPPVVVQMLYANGDKANNHSAEISHCADVGGFKVKEAIESPLGHPPKKLLSNRKTLSPTSQEKLCQAVDVEESCDSEQLSSHKESELLLSQGRITKKPKNEENGSLPHIISKGILKAPLPCTKPCSCMKSSLIHKHTQEAITFSQQQMHDTESLVMKLMKGLKSMKSIVEETFNSEACSCASSKYTTDEMRIAVENASELEETTKRWLSMMGRDCNRFCKIMKSTVNKFAGPVNGARNKRKKIAFADEAGGVLCQVKVFEELPSSSVGSESEKAVAEEKHTYRVESMRRCATKFVKNLHSRRGGAIHHPCQREAFYSGREESTPQRGEIYDSIIY